MTFQIYKAGPELNDWQCTYTYSPESNNTVTVKVTEEIAVLLDRAMEAGRAELLKELHALLRVRKY
jgi:hypothetical protein